MPPFKRKMCPWNTDAPLAAKVNRELTIKGILTKFELDLCVVIKKDLTK